MGNWLQTTIELTGLPEGAIVEEKHPAGDWIVGRLELNAIRAAGHTAVAEALAGLGLEDTLADSYDLDKGGILTHEEQSYGTGALEDADLPEKLQAAGIAFRFYDDGDGTECMPNEIRWEPGWSEIRRRDAICEGDIAIGANQAAEMLRKSGDYMEFGRRIAEHLALPDPDWASNAAPEGAAA